MTWTCSAIDHGVTIFPNGKIGPCCQVDAGYLKPILDLTKTDRFADLKMRPMSPTHPCNKCSVAEFNGLPSYKQTFDAMVTTDPGIQFLDIRNTNFCNLKCRYCGPHFSSQWAEELKQIPVIVKQDIAHYKDTLITDSLHWLYFTGGEPLINTEHWELLEELIANGQSQQIALNYNTNLTTIKYKSKNIIELWKKFQHVNIQISIDAVEEPAEYIRSGVNWIKFKSNLEELLNNLTNSNITIGFSPVISILNIWFIDQLYKYAKQIGVAIRPIVLTGPDYLALDVVPDSLKELALEKINNLHNYDIDKNTVELLEKMIIDNRNKFLFEKTISHVLLLDSLRNEKLFDLLPFQSYAVENILKNYEYQ